MNNEGGAGCAPAGEGIYELLSRLENGVVEGGEQSGAGGADRVMALLAELGLVGGGEDHTSGAVDGTSVVEGVHAQNRGSVSLVGGAGSVRGSQAGYPLRDSSAEMEGNSNNIIGSVMGKPAHLVESVYDGVRSKIRRLQDEVKEKEDTIALLHKVRGAQHLFLLHKSTS